MGPEIPSLRSLQIGPIRIWYSARVRILSQKRVCYFLQTLALATVCIGSPDTARGQQAATVPPPAGSDAAPNAEFTAAADEVLEQMSEITGLKLQTPLKKTLRSRGEIRAYVIKQMDEDKNPS